MIMTIYDGDTHGSQDEAKGGHVRNIAAIIVAGVLMIVYVHVIIDLINFFTGPYK